MSMKLVMMGAGSVGKSAITIQFVNHQFVTEYDPTIADSYKKPAAIDGKQVMLDILDTAGQDDFVSVRDSYFGAGEGFLLVFDVSSRSSLEEIESLRDQILRVKDAKKFPMVMVGNKCDLPAEEHKVSEDEARALAESFGIPFFKTSAKEQINIEESFHALVREVWNSRPAEKKSGGGGCLVL
ncbi:Small GTPase superfamily [Carpediemonas membranifera]|uniref:small monomeric GTPase n=1 Tax=Carpediemonas membranifera TaxID=201153 RepID=A0A8J6AYR5_9EUKA|nr:Small GTPase superfamily [Carpediemonas membranifera]|eukprot:KAG9390529.1 Small GTPase superfamily [Carpediemonas membranifera]